MTDYMGPSERVVSARGGIAEQVSHGPLDIAHDTRWNEAVADAPVPPVMALLLRLISRREQHLTNPKFVLRLIR